MTTTSAYTQQAIKRAKRLVLSRFSPGTSRKEATHLGKIASVGTRRIADQCLKNYLEWRYVNGLSVQQQDNRIQLVTYLQERAEGVSQATLNQIRNMLQLVLRINLPMVRSELETVRGRRSYSAHEISLVMEHQNEKNQISTAIASAAGLRAHELATICRISELSPSDHREWDHRLFRGMTDVNIYVVAGKGGLRRKAAIPTQLAAILEHRRFETPQRAIDRGVIYWRRYDIGIGQAFSQSFTSASKRALNFSRGAHGLRHSYTKARTATLRALGLTFSEAQIVVSQELGHFRPSITLAYYR